MRPRTVAEFKGGAHADNGQVTPTNTAVMPVMLKPADTVAKASAASIVEAIKPLPWDCLASRNGLGNG
jgi:hypothetical protein